MPIYEFYCADCHTIFNFFSQTINTTKKPLCPLCKKVKLDRQISSFSAIGKAKEEGGIDDLPIDERKMEDAVTALAQEAGNMDENDPRGAARLMRKLSSMTGLKYGEGVDEALNRLESGEDIETVESEMGDLMNDEDPFVLPDKKRSAGKEGKRTHAPQRDETLYEL